MELINKNQFKIKWGRFDNYLRNIKLNEYVDNLVNTNKLDKNTGVNLKKDLNTLLVKGSLKKSNAVDYDIETCSIRSIKCLEIIDKKYTLS